MSQLSKLFKNNISLHIPFWFLLFVPLVAYGIWEIYWFLEVGLSFVKWHTHLMCCIYLWLFGVIVFYKVKLFNPLLVYSSVIFCLLLLELFFHISGINKTYSEKRSGIYQSVFSTQSTDSVRAYSTNNSHKLLAPEFDYLRTTNNDGFSDFPFYTDTNKVLIQTYGDSFTEGDGAPFDSSYPAILRKLLAKQSDKYIVQNYGICGNDPGFYANQFAKVGRKYEPNVLIMGYGTGDFIVDFLSRGGLERFDEKGWHTRKGPWWEIIYATNYTSRYVFHALGYEYNNFFMSESERMEQFKIDEKKWIEVFRKISALVKESDCKVLLFKKPERNEIVHNTYQYNMSFFDDYLATDSVFIHIDLMEKYHAKGLTSQENTVPYYWPLDGHHNSNGYRVMAEILYDALNDKFPEYFWDEKKL